MNTDHKTALRNTLVKVLSRYTMICMAILMVFPFYASWKEMKYSQWLTGNLLEDFWRVAEYMVLEILPQGWWLIILIATFFLSFTAIGVRWAVLMMRRII